MARCGARFSILLLCAVVFLAAVGCQKAEPPLDEVTVHLGWHHSAQVGWMLPDVWQGTYDVLLAQRVLGEPLDVASVYTMEFLHEIYGGQEP